MHARIVIAEILLPCSLRCRIIEVRCGTAVDISVYQRVFTVVNICILNVIVSTIDTLHDTVQLIAYNVISSKIFKSEGSNTSRIPSTSESKDC